MIKNILSYLPYSLQMPQK